MEANDLNGLIKEIPFQWRVQSINQSNAICVAYIDSRQVQDLLDEICGPENWQSDYKEVKGNMFAGVGIFVDGQWVWKWDCGTESNTEKEKGEASDSFKRAAVKWGIGRFLYSLPITRLKSINKGTADKPKYYPLYEEKNEAIYDKDKLTTYINWKLQKQK